MASRNWNERRNDDRVRPVPANSSLLTPRRRRTLTLLMIRPFRRALARHRRRCLVWSGITFGRCTTPSLVSGTGRGTRVGGVEDFARRCVTDGSLVADVGCGNGKNAPIVASRGGFAVGCDFSAGLLDICAEERGLEVFAADATCLPVRSGTFDVALNIAVLHHVSSHRRRVALVSETMRLLRVGGAALFYAWALEQDVGGVSGHQFDAQDVLVPFHKRPVREAGGKKTDGTPKGPKGPKEPDAGGSETVRSRDAGAGRRARRCTSGTATCTEKANFPRCSSA